MRRPGIICSLLLIAACADKPHPENEPEVIGDTTTTHTATTAVVAGPVDIPQVDDNIAHDTLLIQTTFELNDGSYIMVASHKDHDATEERAERTPGLRLYHYRPRADGDAEIIARSSPAYDSWTMFPTFFSDPFDPGSYIVLANFGERNSWGQKVIRFGPQGFTDMGFLNVALIERADDGEEERIKYANIAPYTRLLHKGEGIVFTFDAEEILLYDDLRGGMERTFSGEQVSYRWTASEGMTLYVEGEMRLEQQPG